jgi:hypothetical protein
VKVRWFCAGLAEWEECMVLDEKGWKVLCKIKKMRIYEYFPKEKFEDFGYLWKVKMIKTW